MSRHVAVIHVMALCLTLVLLPLTAEASEPDRFSRVDYPTGQLCKDVIVVDITGDGYLDAVSACAGSDCLMILSGCADGNLKRTATLSTADEPVRVLAGDYNGDSLLDLVVVERGSRTISLFRRTGTTAEGEPLFAARRVLARTASPPAELVQGDFNGDGRLDLVVTLPGTDQFVLYAQSEDGTFNDDASRQWSGDPEALCAADFDGDGWLDLAVADSRSGTVLIWLNKMPAEPNFRAAAILPRHFDHPTALQALDLDADGTLEIVVVDSAADMLNVIEVVVSEDPYFPLGFQHSNYPVPGGPTDIAVGDTNGDGRLDLMVAAKGGSTAQVLLQEADGSFASATAYGVASSPVAIAAGNIDSDGLADLVLACEGAHCLTLLATEPAGTGFAVEADPAGGHYRDNQWVTLSSARAAAIYYTRDGTDPTLSSPRYTGPIPIYGSTVLKFFGADANGHHSPTFTEDYVIDRVRPTATADPQGGHYQQGIDVELTASEEAVIHFTLDSSVPTEGSPEYSDPIEVDRDTILRFIAIDRAGNRSPVYTEVYSIEHEAPIVGELEANISFHPQTLNCIPHGRRGHGRRGGPPWVTVYIELPRGYDVRDIDRTTVLLNGEIPAITSGRYGWVKNLPLSDHDRDGRLELMVRFGRAEASEVLCEADEPVVEITGECNGKRFWGRCEVRLIR